MPERIKKNLLGRTVTKSTYKSGDLTINRKTVKNKKGEAVRLKSVGKQVSRDAFGRKSLSKNVYKEKGQIYDANDQAIAAKKSHKMVNKSDGKVMVRKKTSLSRRQDGVEARSERVKTDKKYRSRDVSVTSGNGMRKETTSAKNALDQARLYRGASKMVKAERASQAKSIMDYAKNKKK